MRRRRARAPFFRLAPRPGARRARFAPFPRRGARRRARFPILACARARPRKAASAASEWARFCANRSSFFLRLFLEPRGVEPRCLPLRSLDARPQPLDARAQFVAARAQFVAAPFCSANSRSASALVAAARKLRRACLAAIRRALASALSLARGCRAPAPPRLARAQIRARLAPLGFARFEPPPQFGQRGLALFAESPRGFAPFCAAPSNAAASRAAARASSAAFAASALSASRRVKSSPLCSRNDSNRARVAARAAISESAASNRASQA